jgi:multiple sugar transport system substrate-binding protein
MMKRGRWTAAVLMLTVFMMATACGLSSSADRIKEANPTNRQTSVPVRLTFMYWGSAFEKRSVESMVEAFEASHPNIQIDAQHITGDYATKINTLMAAGELPDVAYLTEALALEFAEKGRILDMTDYVKIYPELANRLPQTYYYFAPGKTIGTNTAAEICTLFYNKDLFSEADVEFPPASPDEAWTWDEFVQAAQRLTKDINGKHPTESGFDPNNIVQYGVSFPTSWVGWYPFLVSNGADITNEDGTEYTLNRPEAVEVLQKLQDLMFTYHVAPTAIQLYNMSTTSARLETKKVAMAIDGQWNLLDFASSTVNVGIGVLPKLKQAKTVVFGAPTVIFSSTNHPEEALEFYLYHNDPRKVDLYSQGLWMPLELKYYTEEKYIKQWTDNDAHPPEFKEAVIDYALYYSVPAPTYRLRNWSVIYPRISESLDLIWTNKKRAQEVLDELKRTVEPLLQGKYPAQ